MKVFDLRCGNDHGFEGWFASEDDFRDQDARHLISCPACGDEAIVRLPSAPRIGIGRSRPSEERAASPEAKAPVAAAAVTNGHEVTMQSQWLRAIHHVMSTTEDVGERFPEEARRIHYGEADERAIRGRASPADAEALREEGIEVMALPIPEALKKPLQ